MKEQDNTQTLRKGRLFFFYEKYMLLVGTAGQMLFFFQAIKIFMSKSAADVSLPGFTAGFISVSSWLVYGILIKNTPLVVANLVACVGAFLVILGILIHG